MSTIRSYDDALDFYPSTKPTGLARFRGGFQHVRIMWEALIEGHAAARRYHELTSRGMSHDEAASRVFSEHYRAS